MTSHFNLPSGVSPTDIPGNNPNEDECETCGGLGEVEDGRKTCPTCGGLGVYNTRTKGAQDAD